MGGWVYFLYYSIAYRELISGDGGGSGGGGDGGGR